MSKIDQALEHLIETVLESDEYREFDARRNEIKRYPELKARLDEFRERNFLLQMSDNNAFDKMEQLEREYEDIIENSMVSEFLEAELSFCRMMQDINLRLTEALNFE